LVISIRAGIESVYIALIARWKLIALSVRMMKIFSILKKILRMGSSKKNVMSPCDILKERAK
jgi:hypothetical protein